MHEFLSKHLLITSFLIVIVNLTSFILISPYAPSATAGFVFLLPVSLLVNNFQKMSLIFQIYTSGAMWKIFLISGACGIGTIIGSLISASSSRKFRLRKPRSKVAVRAFIGGLFMGLGVTLTHGCNIFHILGGTPLLIPASVLTAIAIILGAYICLKLMLKYIVAGGS